MSQDGRAVKDLAKNFNGRAGGLQLREVRGGLAMLQA